LQREVSDYQIMNEFFSLFARLVKWSAVRITLYKLFNNLITVAFHVVFVFLMEQEADKHDVDGKYFRKTVSTLRCFIFLLLLQHSHHLAR
jgi:hypothetical protein